jgi:hypothetical protein
MSILKFALFTRADKQFKIQNSKRQNLMVPGFLATFKMSLESHQLCEVALCCLKTITAKEREKE